MQQNLDAVGERLTADEEAVLQHLIDHIFKPAGTQSYARPTGHAIAVMMLTRFYSLRLATHIVLLLSAGKASRLRPTGQLLASAC
mmetsp:Transcript_60573/g.107307  ORF Transcript_60573/g.107307 Transcript_60573/m.107307 type:complete len:85 (+) Transcript_60573:155-409(+)